MRRIETLYLAGPETSALGGASLLALQIELAALHGLTVLKTDAPAPPAGDEVQARAVYAEKVSRMRRADACIVNLTPFRGPDPDAATTFEMGFLAGLGKPIVGWMNVTDEEDAEHLQRIEAWIGARMDEAGVWRDGDDCLIEEYGLPTAMMPWAETRRLFLIVTDDPLRDLAGYEMCLQALRLYAD